LYGGRRDKGQGWTLDGVREWVNLYRVADLIGRDLLACAPFQSVAPYSRDVILGYGGHIGYFEDRRVAEGLIALSVSPVPAANETVTEAGGRPCEPVLAEAPQSLVAPTAESENVQADEASPAVEEDPMVPHLQPEPGPT
jgi:hypothetical protein